MTRRIAIDPPKEMGARQLLAKLQVWNREPDYQRRGDVWDDERVSFFIDSLINGFLIPPIYLHEYPAPMKVGDRVCSHAIVDGKQRLTAIESFYGNKVRLAHDFLYEKGRELNLQGLNYEEIRAKAPWVIDELEETMIPVVSIHAAEGEYINQLFSRLNEGAPLNNAERRNAFTGPFPPATRRLALHQFFRKWYPKPNKRYQHYDVAAKFLLLENQGIVKTAAAVQARDLKPVDLDEFAKSFVGPERQKALDAKLSTLLKATEKTLDELMEFVPAQHHSLNGVGMTCILFMLAQEAKAGTWEADAGFDASLDAFEKVRATARRFIPRPGDKSGEAVARVQRYNTMNQRNEGSSFVERRDILKWFAEEYSSETTPTEFLGITPRQLGMLF